MLVYLEIKNMTFEEETDSINHQIITYASKEKIDGFDEVIETKRKLMEIEDDTCFITREQNTWFSFPLYELKDGKIIDFDYTKYQYFADSDRREMLVGKISDLYNAPSEAKILRKTLKKILDHLGIADEDFLKYNNKVETIIKNNPKKLKKSI